MADTSLSASPDSAISARNSLVDKLIADGHITSHLVEAAFHRVARHLFAPEVPVQDAYADDIVRLKADSHGITVSSVSAPWLQAVMLEQAGLRQGHAVCEIGTSGYNAALIAEIVGPAGLVVSVDIDADLTGRARELLTAAGYSDQVQVIQADASNGLPGHHEFDRIIVTVGAWDIAPDWLTRLASDGVLVVPLRMNGITRSIAFRRESDHLVSTSAEVCGFVPIQGSGAHADRQILLSDGSGRQVTLSFDTAAPGIAEISGILRADPVEEWTGITLPHRTSFADLYLWFGAWLPGFCRVTAQDDTELAATCFKTWFPYGAAHDGSLVVLAVRPTPDETGTEFGARAWGPGSRQAATAMATKITAWHQAAAGGRRPAFAYWPDGSNTSGVPAAAGRFPKQHGLVTIIWTPATGLPAGQLSA